MSLTILRASRRTAPSFPFSHASYSFSARESDLLADSIVPAASRCGGGTAPPVRDAMHRGENTGRHYQYTADSSSGPASRRQLSHSHDL